MRCLLLLSLLITPRIPTHPSTKTQQSSHHKRQADLVGQGYAAVVLATGVLPRRVTIPGIEHPKVLSYVDVLRHKKPVRI